jgi:putative redox protein
MPSEKIEFTGAGGETLAARLETPRTAPIAYALFAHCFTCGKDIAAASRISRALCDHGIAVLRFDFTGLGGSDGDFANTNFSSNVGDLVAAANFLRETYHAPKLLVGHSLGGAAVIAAADSVPECKAVATIGAPSDPGHVTHLFEGHLDEIAADGEAEVQLAGRPFRIKKQFVEDVSERTLTAALGSLRRALCVFHSPIDELVGISNARDIFVAAKHPKTFVSLDNADHLLRSVRDAQYTATVLAAWASRFIDDGAEPDLPKGEEGTVVVRETRDGKFQQNVVAGPHRLLADEPLSYGGDNTGPTPYDLLLAGLGACTTMTMRMYAERKGWPLERASVTMTHQKIHAKDCDTCETTTGKVDLINRDIRIEGPELDAEQRARLMEIADRCPVHRTLHSEVKITSREVE